MLFGEGSGGKREGKWGNGGGKGEKGEGSGEKGEGSGGKGEGSGECLPPLSTPPNNQTSILSFHSLLKDSWIELGK